MINKSAIFQPNLEDVFKHINLQMLFGKHLGFKGNFKKELKNGNEKAKKLWGKFEEIKSLLVADRHAYPLLRPQAIYKFFNANAEKNKIFVKDEEKSTLKEFNFPRNSKFQIPNSKTCLADLITSQNNQIAFFVATAGQEILHYTEELKQKNKLYKSFFIQALALEIAEASAELAHQKICKKWKIDRNKSSRYSFGYPTCPNLEDQKKLFDLIKPEKIGVKLSDGFMMEPEASVSAMVFQNQ